MSIEKEQAVKVVCGHCDGSGIVYDFESSKYDAEGDMCRPCEGRGFHFMQEWKNGKTRPPVSDEIHQFYGIFFSKVEWD